MDKLVVQLIDRVNELAENGAEDVTGVRTGFYDLDRMTAGPAEGRPDRAGGAPSMGKTAFALNIAENVAVQRRLPVLVFSMEMGASQLALRMVGSLGRIDQSTCAPAAGRRRMGPPGRGRRQARQGAAVHRRDAGAHPAELRARARRMARQFGGTLGLIVIDYLQLMSGSGGSDENRATEIGEISRGLKAPGQGTAVPGDRAVAAQPQRRDAHRQAADDERPARVRRHRAGRRRHHVHLPRRVLHQGPVQGAGRGRDHHRQAAQRPGGHGQADLPEAADQVRQPGAGQHGARATTDPRPRTGGCCRHCIYLQYAHSRPPIRHHWFPPVMAQPLKGRGTAWALEHRFSSADAPGRGRRLGHAGPAATAEDPATRRPRSSKSGRSILAGNDSPDIGFDLSINPYRGCEHGCIYCYARPTHSYLNLSPGLDFETRIVAKVNAAERCARRCAGAATRRCCSTSVRPPTPTSRPSAGCASRAR
jgi:hypothetical protein